MLAIRRTDNVIGRTSILTVSISTRRGVSGIGALFGARCASDAIGLNVSPLRTSESHSGIARTIAIDRWLVKEKKYGIRPIRFITIIIVSRAAKVIETPNIRLP